MLLGVLLIAGCGSSHPTGYFNMTNLDLAIHNRQVEKENQEKETGAFDGFLDPSNHGRGYHFGVHCIATGHQSALCELTIVNIETRMEEGHCLNPCSVNTETPKTLQVTIAPDGKSFVVGG
jgi:hypothetical protein